MDALAQSNQSRGALPKPALGDIQNKLRELQGRVRSVTTSLNRAGLSETQTFILISNTGAHLDQLLKELDELPLPTEIFDKLLSGVSTEVGLAHENGD